MHPTLTIAKRAVYSAGKIINRGFDQLSSIKPIEKSENNYVSEIDIAVEQEIIKTLKYSYPDHSFLSEEGGEIIESNKDYLWVIDPLDGTTNFLKGFPHFAISVALFVRGKLEVGLVYNPITDELFSASRGNGATLNGRRIRSSSVSIDNAIIATGVPFKKPEMLPTYLSCMRDGLNIFPDIRRMGSASLDLCYLSSGRVDGYFELGLEKWDIAAGALIAQESGVIVSDINGEMTHFTTGNIVAAPPKIYKELIKITRKRS